MIDAIIKAIQNNQIETLALGGVVVFIIWLFKEQRAQYISHRKENIDSSREALVIYAELFNELKNSEKLDLEKIELIFQKAIPFLPKGTIQKYFKFVESSDNEEDLLDLKKDIESEIYRLKNLQKDLVSYRHDNYIDSVEFLFYTSRLDTFFKPLMYTSFLVFLLIVFVSFSSIFILEGFDNKTRIEIFTKGVSLLFLFTISLVIIELCEKKKFKHTIFNWALTVAFYFLVIGLTIYNYWFLGFVNIAINLVYVFLFLYKLSKR